MTFFLPDKNYVLSVSIFLRKKATNRNTALRMEPAHVQFQLSPVGATLAPLLFGVPYPQLTHTHTRARASNPDG